MKFSFDVGQQERHRVDFSFNQFFGNLSIHVDGVAVRLDFRFLSLNLVKRYEFPVGQQERHHVVIEHERKLLFAGFRPQKYRVFVDGQPVAQHEGF